MFQLTLPSGLQAALDALRGAGGRPLLVGGAVRDALLGRPVKDFDVEVYGLGADALARVLARVGRVDTVGQAFAVFKLSRVPGVDGAIDVSLPRRDSKSGPGHRGIAAQGDPHLPLAEAARRRDFTMNAMLFDPERGALLDPHGGRSDLAAGVLRAVDESTFGEDPLRGLRAVQLAARFELRVEPATAALCRAMPLLELPVERVWGELEKLLLRARRPSLGFELMHAWGFIERLLPELAPLRDTPQDPEWHPEGDVWTHTMQAVDQAARLIDDLEPARALCVMLGALCHDLGKPATTRFEDGRWRSRGHEEAGVAPTQALLERLGLFTWHGYDLRAQVVALVAQHLKPGQLYESRARVSDGAIRRLAGKCEPDLLARVARADCLGREPGRFEPVAMDWFLERVRALGVARRPPEALLKGRDLLALGVPPGPRVGRVLRALYERQLDGEFADADAAREAARALLARDEASSQPFQ